jgi:acyl-CoA synthetase (AMP-forming)/AMP-acid ligase II
LKHQLLDSGAKALFTCVPLLPVALEAAALAGLPKSKIYLIDVPQAMLGSTQPPKEFKSVSDILEVGKSLPPVDELKWGPGDGARRTAFLCYSSGTSGLPVGIFLRQQFIRRDPANQSSKNRKVLRYPTAM